MTNFIPIFPLEIVVFPTEHLNLHIFEPRYKQLIKDCFEQKKPFGVPSIINDELKEYGTLIYVKEVFKIYDNGEMDIRTEGGEIFRILEIIKNIPEKLYSGAIVNYPENNGGGNTAVMAALLAKMREMHAGLRVVKNFKKADDDLMVYDIAHHCGLSILQEYELLQLTTEKQRLEYLRRYFENVHQGSLENEALRDKIKMNGHFKHLSSSFNW
ncbi:MAG: LON peptidase substrate-binding domain-containing protein [Niabella sp.]